MHPPSHLAAQRLPKTDEKEIARSVQINIEGSSTVGSRVTVERLGHTWPILYPHHQFRNQQRSAVVLVSSHSELQYNRVMMCVYTVQSTLSSELAVAACACDMACGERLPVGGKLTVRACTLTCAAVPARSAQPPVLYRPDRWSGYCTSVRDLKVSTRGLRDQ